MKKIMWVKFGWSEFYRGGAVDGNFGWLNAGRSGHEPFNFLPGPDSEYYCYVPPHGPAEAAPYNQDPYGWTVVCLAKFPAQTGLHVVGWYEDAELMGEWLPRPEYEAGGGFPLDDQGKPFTYSIKAKNTFFVPPEFRNNPFSHPSVRQAKYSYLSGPDVVQTPEKKEVLEVLTQELARLEEFAVQNPNAANMPDDSENSIDPMGGFGTPEHRRDVELAAEKAVTLELEARGYSVKRRSDEKIGYDLQGIPHKGKQEWLVEVKGTAGSERRFYMTPNELQFSEAKGWRLAVVTQALNAPSVTFYTRSQMKKLFNLQPMTWVGREIKNIDDQ